MAYHVSNLGSFGPTKHTDMDGYVPEEKDGPWDLDYEHAEETHDEDGELTEYGEWWEWDQWPEILREAVAATAEAMAALRRWEWDED